MVRRCEDLTDRHFRPQQIGVVDRRMRGSKVAPSGYRPRMVAVGGGYPILEDGKLIGGIGILGGTYQQNQDACVEALEKIGLQLPA